MDLTRVPLAFMLQAYRNVTDYKYRLLIHIKPTKLITLGGLFRHNLTKNKLKIHCKGNRIEQTNVIQISQVMMNRFSGVKKVFKVIHLIFDVHQGFDP